MIHLRLTIIVTSRRQEECQEGKKLLQSRKGYQPKVKEETINIF